jgi:hypothetical protein
MGNVLQQGNSMQTYAVLPVINLPNSKPGDFPLFLAKLSGGIINYSR